MDVTDENGVEAGVNEFACLAEVAEELDLPVSAIPAVRREFLHVDGAQRVSVLVWGSTDPEVVFLHGGGQNAHTWDLVALQLGRPAIAVDLPGHGHSDWRTDRDYWPARNAQSVAKVVERWAPRARGVVGMSLGGLTGIRLAAARPDLVSSAVIVDVTPGVQSQTDTMNTAQRGTTALIAGPRSYESLDAMVAQTLAASPRRSPTAVRRGVGNNARQAANGQWVWRYDVMGGPGGSSADFRPLWEDLSTLRMPVMLVCGGDSAFVSAADRAEFGRRSPHAQLVSVAAAGHSVQSDQPVALAELIRQFVFERTAS